MKALSVVAALALGLFASCALPHEGDEVRYVCFCGEECPCQTVSNEPGKCECGEYLVPE
ncbi:MAG: hypothetical protein ACQKBU_11665 [Verrucomicrobiales bacterium]